MSNDKDIRFNPEKMIKLLKELKRKRQEKPKETLEHIFYEIDNEKMLGFPHSKRVYNDFLEDWPRVLTFVEDVKHTRYFYSIRTFEHAVSESLKSREQMAREGLWPYSKAPTGWRVGKDRVLYETRKAKAVARAFGRVDKGEPYTVACEEEGVEKETLRSVVHKGYIPWHDEVLPGKHKARRIVDEQRWGRVQKILQDTKKAFPRKGLRKLSPVMKIGFKRHGTSRMVDDTKTEMLREIFMQVKKGRSKTAISREFHISTATLYNVLNNPDYRGIVGKLWDDVQDVERFGVPKIRDSQDDAKLQGVLDKNGPARYKEILRLTGFPRVRLRESLKRLTVACVIGKEPSHLGRWYLLETQTAQITPLETKDKILSALEEPSTLTELVNKAKIGKTTVKRWLPRLIAQGLVEKRSELGKRYPVYVKVSVHQKAE